MEKIVIHWTAGANIPNKTDKKHYHYLFDSAGQLHAGYFKPEDNIICKNGKYAEHTGGGNTGSIGVALCGMYGFKNSKNQGKAPITKKQLEACLCFVAGLCVKYGISVKNVLTHYEFGLNNPDTTSKGKIDIIFLPPYPEIPANKVGNFLRGKIIWYMDKIERGVHV